MFEGDPYFSVVPTTGQVQVAVASIDREYRDQYIMRIRGVDQGTPSLTGSVNVIINILDSKKDRNSLLCTKSFAFHISLHCIYSE